MIVALRYHISLLAVVMMYYTCYEKLYVFLFNGVCIILIDQEL